MRLRLVRTFHAVTEPAIAALKLASKHSTALCSHAPRPYAAVVCRSPEGREAVIWKCFGKTRCYLGTRTDKTAESVHIALKETSDLVDTRFSMFYAPQTQPADHSRSASTIDLS